MRRSSSHPSPFNPLKDLGVGTFGRVYKAQWREPSGNVIEVAIKEYDKNKIYEKNMDLCVKNEISLHSKLTHFNIIHYKHTLYKSLYIYCIIELAECSLDKVILGKSVFYPLSKQHTLSILSGVIDALSYLHEHHILHRDIKMANVLLDQDGNAKICDFGFAVDLNNPTDMNILLGTPSHAAPELLAHHQRDGSSKNYPYSPQSDIYAFAIMTWEILHEQEYFPENWTRAVCFKKILGSGRQSIWKASKDLSWVMQQGWQQEPSARPTLSTIKQKLESNKALCNQNMATQVVEETKPQPAVVQPVMNNSPTRMMHANSFFNKREPNDKMTHQVARPLKAPCI